MTMREEAAYNNIRFIGKVEVNGGEECDTTLSTHERLAEGNGDMGNGTTHRK